MNGIDFRQSARRVLRALSLVALVLVASALVVPDVADARGGGRGGGGGGARAGGGGGGRMAQPSVSGANRAASANRSAAGANRSSSSSSDRSRDVERSSSREVSRETDIEIDGDYDIDDGFDHPWAAAATIGAMASMTAAAVGSMYYSVPPDCVVVMQGGVQYHQCGSVYYEERYEGDQVVYVAVQP